MSDRVSRPHFRLLFAAATSLGLLLTLGAPAARAATWYVHPGGSGNATTIQGGLALAQSGDIVRVAAGTYMEHDLQLPPGVTLVSESGRDATIIDAQGLGHGVIGADGSVVRGFTIEHAGPLNRHAVYCYETSPAVLDNRFVDNYERTVVLFQSTSEVAGNEFFAHAPSPNSHVVSNQSTPWIHDNVFHADDPNGNISAIEMSDVRAGGIGAARIETNVIYGRTFISSLTRTDTTRVIGNVCVVRNGFSEVFNIAFNPSPLLIRNNTMVGGSGVFLQGNSKAALLGNIVIDGRYGIQAWGGEVVLDCNDVFHCQTGYAGVSPGPHDFSADPLFCSSAAGDYHLRETSPCAPALAFDGCGLVGALPVACTNVNRGPSASAGGPYSAIAGFPLMLDGTASSDPDGDALTSAWTFGDGGASSSPTPTHTYLAPSPAGGYIVTLRVTDPGGLFDDDATTATIRAETSVALLLKKDKSTLNLDNYGLSKFGIEEVEFPYADLIVSTLRLTTDFPNAGTVSECAADTKHARVGDLDRNGVPDLEVRFSGFCLRNLFQDVPNDAAVNLVITGQFQTPAGTAPLRGVKVVTIRRDENNAPVLAAVSPNPFNPQARLSFVTMRPGNASVHVFDLHGRLVRVLIPQQYMMPGVHEVRIDGQNAHGIRLSSGVYFYQVKSADGVCNGTFAILK